MALREVNLVPARLVYRRRVVRHVAFWSACLLIAIGTMAGFFVYQKHIIQAQRPALQSLDEVQMLLAERKSLLKGIRTELQKLNQQRVVLGKITQNRSYCQVLWRLSEIFNDETWLTQLTIDRIREEDTTIRMSLNGLSYSNATLGNFMSQISGDPQFNDVRLVYAKEGSRKITKSSSAQPLKLIRFEIESTVANR